MRRRSRAAALAAIVAGVCALPAATQTGSVRVERDVEYASPPGSDPLLLDAYVPDVPGPHPAVVWIHGGRWYVGDKTDDEELITALSREGIAVFSINYRLAKEAPYPAAVEDVTAAVEWIRENAEAYDVDPERVGAVGVSSGGHLAALLATLGEGPLDHGSRVAAAVTFSGPMDLVPALGAGTEDRLGKAVSLFLACESGPACEAAASEASPVEHVDPTDAPMLMVNALEEVVPFEQAASMAAALESAGVDHQLAPIPGDTHGTTYVTTEKAIQGGATLPVLYTEFLKEHLGVTRSPGSPSPSPSPDVTQSPAPQAAPASEDARAGSWSVGSVVGLALVAAALGGILVAAIVRRRRDREPY